MQQRIVFSTTVLLAITFCKLVYAQACPSPLPANPTAAQVISCISEMQREIDDLKNVLANRPLAGSPKNLEFVRPALYGPNWSTYGGQFTQNFEYAIDIDGIVHLRGLMEGCPTDQPIFTLPTGYRPAIRAVFATIGGDGSLNARVDVLPNGDVVYVYTEKCTDARPWLTLDGISFKAEQ